MAAHLKLHHQPISALEVLADDTHVLAACHDRSVSLWDLQEEKCRATFRSPTATILGMVVAPDQVGACPLVACWWWPLTRLSLPGLH